MVMNQFSIKSSLKKVGWLAKMALKQFMTFLIVKRQFTPSSLHPNMGLLSGVIVPVSVELTGLNTA